MRTSIGLASVGILAAMTAACSGSGTSAGPQPTSSNQAAAPAAMADRDMIVLLRDQLTTLGGSRDTTPVRAAAIAASHGRFIADLQAARPRSIRSFELVNGFASRLSQTEIDSLSARPEVLAVVPDQTLKLPRRRTLARLGLGTLGAGSKPAATTPPAPALCDTLEPEALQLTNAAFADDSTPQAQKVIDGNGRPVTGAGVMVGILADGLDTTVPSFVRPDGSAVFADYQDFSGDPAGTPTAGGEMFGDASSIAAQDMPNGKPLELDISQYGGNPDLPSPCNIRVRGMAPGASLVGLKVFSNLGYTSTSGFVQAIAWAVIHDRVDVLNESFGGAPVPDDAQDPISLANAAAVRAGVTVTVSTGDGGTAGTLNSPATDPNVIAAGASTQFRLYAQMDYGLMGLATGYLGGNVSAFSSSGFAQSRPRTADVLAPGDLGWAACSTNQELYTDCSNLLGGPAQVEIFGGTSEAAPLTAGAAALVIQAYRSTHGGQSPSPAMVKTLLQSTASDIGAPSDEQGSGVIDALAAVNAALSVNGASRPHGSGILASPTAAALTAEPGDTVQTSFQISNTGSGALHLQPVLQELGAPTAGQTVTVQLDPSKTPSYLSPTFTVPAGADHLDVSIAFAPSQKGKKKFVVLGLIDPQNRQLADSNPQGNGSGYAHVDVVKPVAGQWTAILYTDQSGARDSYSGPVQMTWATEQYVSLGSVSPAKVDLPPGWSTSLTATFKAPSQPGDLAAALRFPGAAISEIPVTLRTVVPVGARGGAFTGTLTGGNARQGVFPTQTYDFDVPSAVNDLELGLTVPEAGYGLVGYLVDPNGVVLDSASNVDDGGAATNGLALFHALPQSGRWRFVLVQTKAAGDETSIQFSAKIALDGASVSAAALPASTHTKVSAAKGATVALTVTNTSAATKSFFADARLSTLTTATLPQSSCGTATLPGFCSSALLPPRTTAVQFQAQAAAPITMDVVASAGDPDVFATPTGPNAATAFFQAPEVPFGSWYLSPALVGPFGPAGAPTETVTTTTTALLQAFDAAMTSSAGDYWADQVLGTTTYQPLVLAPGASGVITLVIQPNAASVGQQVRGSVYVDSMNTKDGDASGDEIVALPYAYTVTP